MAETYCGKACDQCTWKEQLSCPGCKTGPGQRFNGDCEIAKCVRTKGHDTCGTCNLKGNCGNLRGKDHNPEYRHRRLQREREEKELLAKRVPVLARWLWILFWLIIPSTVGGLLGNETLAQLSPGLYFAGKLLNAASCLVYGGILLKLGSENYNYRISGICTLIAGGVTALITLISGTAEPQLWTLLFTVPMMIVELVGEYNEYTGHSEVLLKLDPDLSEKWSKLWIWYLSMFLSMFGCILLVAILPTLAALILLASLIGLVVVSILKLIYLYRTATLFREYPV